MNALVLATVGTDHHPFQRLVDWLGHWRDGSAAASGVECLVQHGAARPLPGADCRSCLPHDVLSVALQRAVCVVTHAGPGCLMEARHYGHVPIVVPRRRALGEHVDDHQVAFARAAASAGMARVPADREQFCRLLDLAVAGDPSFRLRRRPLVDDGTVGRFAALVADLDPAATLLTSARHR